MDAEQQPSFVLHGIDRRANKEAAGISGKRVGPYSNRWLKLEVQTLAQVEHTHA